MWEVYLKMKETNRKGIILEESSQFVFFIYYFKDRDQEDLVGKARGRH
jgi:hypothetical protein